MLKIDYKITKNTSELTKNFWTSKSTVNIGKFIWIIKTRCIRGHTSEGTDPIWEKPLKNVII